MKMVCRRNAVFVVSVFYDMKGQAFIPLGGPREELEELLHRIELEFQMKCGDIYHQEKDSIAGLLEAPEVPTICLNPHQPITSQLHGLF